MPLGCSLAYSRFAAAVSEVSGETVSSSLKRPVFELVSSARAGRAHRPALSAPRLIGEACAETRRCPKADASCKVIVIARPAPYQQGTQVHQL